MRHSWQHSCCYARKISANAKAVERRKLDIAKRLAEGLEVPPKAQQEIVKVASLKPGDLGEILDGKLDDGGFPAKDLCLAVAFTQEKIQESQEKVQFSVPLKLVSLFF